MDNHRNKEKLTKIITEKPELLQNLNINPRKLFLFVEHLENNNVVVREKGEWDRSGYCSACDFWTCYCGDYNFCPNCGTDMRGAINNG